MGKLNYYIFSFYILISIFFIVISFGVFEVRMITLSFNNVTTILQSILKNSSFFFTFKFIFSFN